MVRLTFHGAAQEVGRSCIEVETQGDRYLLDCGIKFVAEGFEYPADVFNHHELDGVFISHAHLDHTGSLPMFEHYKMVCPVFLTHQTLALTTILLKDSYKIAHIQHLHPAYEKVDIKEVRKASKRVVLDKWYRHRKMTFRYLNAGHIPGSAMILLETDGKRILFTGDFNTRKTQLMESADFSSIVRDFGAIDCLITECTYGHRSLPERQGEEREFLDSVAKVLRRGGVVLVPVFALGRAQEALLMLATRQWGCPIYFDGMCKEMTRAILTQPSSYILKKDILHSMYFDSVDCVSSPQRREQVAKGGPAIIVATSGMMQGGPAIGYLEHLWHDPKNAVFLTGYQVKGTQGRHLIEDGYVHLNGWKTPVRCEVRKFDFSGHADIEGIKKAIWEVNPKKLVFQHGDEESVANMLEWARHETPFEAFGPKLKDVIDL